MQVEQDGALADEVGDALALDRAGRPFGVGDGAAQLDREAAAGHLQEVETGLTGAMRQERLGVAAELHDVERGVDDDARRREAAEDGRVGQLLQIGSVGVCQRSGARRALRGRGAARRRRGRGRGGVGDPRDDRRG